MLVYDVPVAESRSGGGLVLGPFTADRAADRQALDHPVGLGVKVVGPGHGEPVLIDGSAALRRAAEAADADWAEQAGHDLHSGGTGHSYRGGSA